jgi:hypothetical protein
MGPAGFSFDVLSTLRFADSLSVSAADDPAFHRRLGTDMESGELPGTPSRTLISILVPLGARRTISSADPRPLGSDYR